MTQAAGEHAAYDLHLHTFWSYDATAPMEAYFVRARELGLRCLTITDHHVLDALPEVVAMARAYPEIATIPAAELTVTTSMGSVDLLCYGFPLDLPSDVLRVLEQYHQWQRDYGSAISAGMQALGFDFPDEQRLELLHSYRPSRVIEVQGSTHVKNELLQDHFIERGFIAETQDYSGLFARMTEKVHFPPYPRVEDVVPPAKGSGVAVAIAHPHEYFGRGDRSRMEQLRVECRLDGVECAHKKVPPAFTPVYREYCVEHGLFSTGGSDCHGVDHLEAVFARHGGPAEWLDEFLYRVGGRALRP